MTVAEEKDDGPDQQFLGTEEQFRLLVNSVRDYGIFMLDPAGRVATWNLGAEHIKGYRAGEIIGRHFSVFYPPEDAALGVPHKHLALAAEQGRLEYEGVRVRKDGSRFRANVVITALRDEHGELRGFAKVTRDVTERRAAEEELARRSLHDALTGLANRVLLLDRLRHALARLDRGSHRVALFFIDLDGFKGVNDTLGHEAGDQLLVAVAQRLARAVRPEDTVARLGGDEFVILCEEVRDGDAAGEIGQRLQATLAAPVALEHDEIPIRASIGVTVSDRADDDPESLLRDADAAMYQAKGGAGLDTVRLQIFDASMRARVAWRVDLQRSLKRAVDRHELELVYQPLVRLDTGRLHSLEALLRWNRPQMGKLLPAEFIPVAEETGLIRPIGAWVLEQACRQALSTLGSRPGAPPLGISVNVSSRQLEGGDLIDVLDRVIADTGMDPSAICLDITESAAIADAESSTSVLRKLKTLGVSLAIDDFGTGYASLSYLKRLPVDIVKIDRSFVAGLGAEGEDSTMVAAIIKVAQTLGLRVVAEGVETAEQVAELRGLGCQYAQGWYFGRPQPSGTLDLREAL